MHHPLMYPLRGLVLASCFAALGIAFNSVGLSQPAAGKSAVPDAAAQTRAENIIKKLFKEDYTRAASDAAAGKELALTLIQQAAMTTDSPSLRFVALREARDLAVVAGDMALAFQAVAELAKVYAVDVLALKTDALLRAGQKATTAETHKVIAETALDLLDEAVLLGNYDSAARLATVAEAGAAKARSLALAARVQKRAEQLQALRELVEGLDSAIDKLRTQPKDPQANLIVGRYQCLVKGDWERGLPLLARGNDAGLQKLAQRELAAPTNADERLVIADGWWELSERLAEPARKRLQERATHWYKLAAPGLEGAAKVRALDRLASTSVGLVRTFTGHTRPVNSAALSADGRYAVSGGDDDDLRLWDVATGKTLRLLKGHTNMVWSVAFSPEGKHILSGGDDQTIRLWNVEDGKEIRRFTGHTDNVNRVTFSPDGRFVLSGSDDMTVRLWDTATGKELRRCEGHQKGVFGVAFSQDGSKIVSGAHDRTLGVWTAATGREIRTIEGHDGGVASVAVLADGKQALSGSLDKTIRLWDLQNARELRRFTGHTGAVLSVAVSPDGKRLLSGSQDKTIRLWDVDTGKEVYRLEGHTGEVNSVVFSADGRLCLSASTDETVRLWRLPR
jgi:hypothetical protein